MRTRSLHDLAHVFAPGYSQRHDIIEVTYSHYTYIQLSNAGMGMKINIDIKRTHASPLMNFHNMLCLS